MLQFRLRTRQSLALALAALIAVPHTGLAQAPAKPGARCESVMQKINLLFVQNSTGMEYDKAKGTLRMKNVGALDPVLHRSPGAHGRPLPHARRVPAAVERGPGQLRQEPAERDALDRGSQQSGPRERGGRRCAIRACNGNDLLYDIKSSKARCRRPPARAVLFIDIFGIWRRHIRRAAIVGTAVAVTTAAVAQRRGERRASAAAAKARRRRRHRLR